MLSGALLLPTWRLSAQTQEIEKQTQENYKALRKQQTAENKQPDHETRTDNEVRKEDIPSNGRAILSYDPITDGDLRWFGPSNVGTTPEDETKEATAPPFIDTMLFKEQSFAIKRRDLLRYQDGLPPTSAPILHNEVYKAKHRLKSGIKVFGWHPHWMKDAYQSYNFSLLSAVAYFSYELDPARGSYRSVHDWETTDLIPKAHASGCKVLLSISNLGEENNKVFSL
ncbi:MAG: hypothetical protein HC880_05045 [Bacteroidia bacterium]|nr:hypothetical protein [Bacteroidia bacterium]